MHIFGKTKKTAVLLLLVLCLSLLPNTAILAQSSSTSGAETTNSAMQSQSPRVLVPGSASLLLDPSGKSLPFGHGNQIPADILALESAKVLVQEIDPVTNQAYDYLNIGADQRIFPASMTKLMTALLILEAVEGGTVSLDQKQHATWADLTGLYEQDASVVGIEHNEAMTVRDLLYCTLMASGNDAANILTHPLAEHLLYFYELMNIRAEELGMNGTNFANATGLSDDNNYSTLNDMATLLLECLKHPLFKEIAGTKSYTTAPSDEHPEGISITHSIYGYNDVADDEIKNIQGGKTGYIEESHYSLASYHEENGKMYIIISNDAVPSGENVRDHEKLYAYLFTEQGPYKLLNKGELIKELDVKGAEEAQSIPFYVGADLEVMLPLVADLSRYSVELSLPAELKAPLTADQAVGMLTVTDNVRNLQLYKQVFTPGKDVKQSTAAYFQDTYLAYVAYIFGALFLALLVFFVIRSFKKNAPRSVSSEGRFDDFEK